MSEYLAKVYLSGGPTWTTLSDSEIDGKGWRSLEATKSFMREFWQQKPPETPDEDCAAIRAALEQAQAEREADVLSWGNAAIEAQHAETAAVERAELAERRVAELEATLAAARERGRREGLELAAQIADDRESEWSRDYQMMLVPSEHMLGKAHGAREIAAVIRAAKEGK